MYLFVCPIRISWEYTLYFHLNNQVPESELYCSQCKNSLPYCIATGYHIVPYDLTACPLCKFAATKSEFLKLVEDGVVCPMCVETVAASDIKSLNPNQLIRGNEEKEESMEEEENDEDETRPLTSSSRGGSSRMSKI